MEEEYAISVFNEELLAPYGQLSHKQLVSGIEQWMMLVDKEFVPGVVFAEPYLIQVVSVFKQIFLTSLDIAYRYDVHEDYWIPLVQEFLRFKYRTSLTEIAMQNTFADTFESALQSFERIMASHNPDFNKIKAASLKLGARGQYKVLSCENCQEFNDCNREDPEGCKFVNAVQKKIKQIGGESMIPALKIRNYKLHMSIKPTALKIGNMEKELEGVWNYFCLKKEINDNAAQSVCKEQNVKN
jgi:hypothetical protein